MTRPARIVSISFAVIWISFFAWGTILYLNVVSEKYILEYGTYRYATAFAIGFLWLVYILAFTPFPFIPGSSRSFKMIALLIVLAGLSGWFGGGLLITAVNCDGLRPFEKIAPFIEEDKGRYVSLRAVHSSGKTLRFSITAKKWNSVKENVLYVSKGRLGIYWAKT
jgi:hypothetical protein